MDRFPFLVVFEIRPNGIEVAAVAHESLTDSKPLRRAALLQRTPYYTTLAGAVAAVEGIEAFSAGELAVRALQDYFA